MTLHSRTPASNGKQVYIFYDHKQLDNTLKVNGNSVQLVSGQAVCYQNGNLAGIEATMTLQVCVRK